METILDQYVAVIGLDWADKKHDICLLDQTMSKPCFTVIKHAPEDIDEWVVSLLRKYSGQRIALCVELSKGPIISALLKYDFIDIYPVNPKTLSKYRETFSISGAKSDPGDAFLQMDFLLKHSSALTMLKPEPPEMRTLKQMVIQRRGLVEDKVRITNSLTATLKAYYPQVLDWFDDIGTIVCCEFLERWPTLSKVKKARNTTITQFFIEHKSYRGDIIERRIQGIQNAMELTNDRGIIEPSTMILCVRIKQLRILLEAIKEYDNEIDYRSKKLQDYDLFSSLPGAGAKLTPRLMVAFGTQRDQFESSDAVARYAGIAPVTIASGKSSYVRWRYAAPKFLRQTFVEWANQTIKYSYWARAFYDHQRSNGKSHQTAIRALAFKWIRIIYRCWKNREKYDEAKYLLALQARGSSLLVKRRDCIQIA